MLTARNWGLLVAGCIATIAIGSAIGNSYGEPDSAEALANAALLTPLKIAVVAAIVVLFASLPGLMLRVFLDGQAKIGNGALPMVVFLRKHEKAVLIGLWLMVVLALGMALPFILRDLAAEAPR
jgi:hypothetical protein